MGTSASNKRFARLNLNECSLSGNYGGNRGAWRREWNNQHEAKENDQRPVKARTVTIIWGMQATSTIRRDLL